MEDGDLARLYEVWGRVNAHYFSDALMPPDIVIAEMADVGADCTAPAVVGGRSRIRIARRFAVGPGGEGRSRVLFDLMLHECLHQRRQQEGGDQELEYSNGHGPWFVKWCQTITQQLVGYRKTRPVDLASCLHWPFNIRQDGWYRDAWPFEAVEERPGAGAGAFALCAAAKRRTPAEEAVRHERKAARRERKAAKREAKRDRQVAQAVADAMAQLTERYEAEARVVDPSDRPELGLYSFQEAF